jgi:hypothetical protein
MASPFHFEVEMRFASLAEFAAALLLFALAFAAPAHAQNNKPIISGNWYEDRATQSVGSSATLLSFAQTPANKFLDITHVACTIFTLPTQVLATVTLNAGSTYGATDLGRPMSIRGNTTSEASPSTKYYSVVNDQIIYKFGPGRYPTIGVSTAYNGGAATVYAECVIVGELKDN